MSTIALLMLLAGCRDRDALDIHTGEAMGTTYRIKTVGPSADAMPRIRQMLDDLDEDLSTWRDDSWITRFNEAPAGTAMDMPESVAILLEISERLHADTGGCFDPTIGALIRLWGFGAWKKDWRGELTDTQIEAARNASGFHNLRIRDGSVVKLHSGLMLDFSAIAKGYAVDRMGAILREAGIEHFIIEFGGDILAAGRAPGKTGWTIAGKALESPITLSNRAIATSGADFNFRGKLSHILDPRTGYPVAPAPAQFATAATCAEADALATAKFVQEGSLQTGE